MYPSLYRIFMRGNFRLHNKLCKIERHCSLNIQVDDAKGDMVPVATKKRPKRSNKTEAAVKEIMTHLKSSNISQQVLNDIPSRFISKNWFPPESLYLINPDVAAEVGKTIKNYLLKNNDTVPVFEMNPGLGLLTQELINARVVNLNVFEPSISFHQRLLGLLEKNQGKQVSLRVDDLGNIAKLVYQDKVTNGNRVSLLMQDVVSRPWNDPCPVVRVVGSAPNKKFLRNLVFSIAFQSGLSICGRPEYYLIMHPHSYLQLMSQPNDGYYSYRYNSALFQVMYETQLLKKLPRKDFLPWEGRRHSKKFERYRKIRSVDADMLYLVRVVAKPNLLDLVPPENLQLLWYFFKMHLLSRKKKVIPSLEQWIPNCGPRLICQGLTIFTEFGDLSPQQMLKLFQLFTHWPEFPHCAFHTSLETSFLKSFAAEAEDIDDEEDDPEDEGHEGPAPDTIR